MASCENNCTGGDIPIECDENADCGGTDICCVLKSGANTNSVECAATCDGSNADPLCAVDTCAQGSCTPNNQLPAGYDNCI